MAQRPYQPPYNSMGGYQRPPGHMGPGGGGMPPPRGGGGFRPNNNAPPPGPGAMGGRAPPPGPGVMGGRAPPPSRPMMQPRAMNGGMPRPALHQQQMDRKMPPPSGMGKMPPPSGMGMNPPSNAMNPRRGMAPPSSQFQPRTRPMAAAPRPPPVGTVRGPGMVAGMNGSRGQHIPASGGMLRAQPPLAGGGNHLPATGRSPNPAAMQSRPAQNFHRPPPVRNNPPPMRRGGGGGAPFTQNKIAPAAVNNSRINTQRQGFPQRGMQSHSSPQRRTIATQRQQQSSQSSQQQQQQQQQVGGTVPTAAVMAQDTPVIPPIKFLKRSSAVAWCPSSKPQHTGLMASGTTSSTIDASWSAQYSLEIFSSSFGEQSKEMRRIGAVEVAQSFCSVAWGEIGMAEGKHPAGIIAGGFSDGSIGIHDPIAIASGDGKNSRLGECRGHQGGVTCLEFHPTKKNLLASASQDGDVFIWDLANMSRPGLSKPHKASKAHAMGVTAVAWNRAPNVPFILASSSEQGITNIWDLRNKRAIVNMKSPGQYRLATTGLAWHPFDSTQIAVGYKGPVVEIWDLRKRGFPIIKISNETSPYMHMGSVEAMRWCPHEPRVLLTSGDDRRTVLWNAADGSYLTEHSLGGPLNDVQWHPTRPSVLSSSSFEGEIHVHAIHDFGPLVPSWLRRSSGVSFGFGGKLLSFSGDCVDMKSGSPQQQQQQQGTTKITLKRTVTEKKFVMEAKALVQATREMQPRRFCEEKEAAASTENEKEIWRLMNVLLEQSGGQKQDLLLSEFGFQPPQKQQDNNNNSNNDVKENTDNAANANDDIARKAAEDAAATAASLLDENEFWESVQGGGEEEEKKEEGKKEAGDDGSKTEQKKTEEEGTATTTTTTAKTERRAETKIDREIRLAIVVADYEKAANLCAKNGRMADAVLIAQMSPDAELWRRVVQQHFDAHPLSWAQQQLLPMVMKDFQKVVQQADLSSWRETVATLVSYTYDTPNFAPLLNELASRLESAGNTHAATLCYMVSGNIEKAVERWLAEGAHSKEGSSSQGAAASSSEASAAASALQAAIEKLHFYSLARGCNGPPSMIIAKKYCEYAGLLAAQGEAADALFYLKSAIPNPNPKDIETISLLERLNLAIEEEQQQQQQQYSQQQQQQQQQQQHYSQQQHHHHQQQHQQQQQPQRGRQMGMPPHMGGRRGPAPGPRPTRPGGMLRQTPGRTQQQQQPVAALRRPQVAAAASGGAMRMMPPAAGRGGVGSGPRRMMPPPAASAAPGNPAARRGGPSGVPGDRSRPPPASAAAAGGGRFGTPMGGGGRFAAAGPAGGRFGPPPSARPGRGLTPRPAPSNGGGVQRGGAPAAAGRMLRAPAPGGLMQQQQQQQPPPGRTGIPPGMQQQQPQAAAPRGMLPPRAKNPMMMRGQQQQQPAPSSSNMMQQPPAQGSSAGPPNPPPYPPAGRMGMMPPQQGNRHPPPQAAAPAPAPAAASVGGRMMPRQQQAPLPHQMNNNAPSPSPSMMMRGGGNNAVAAPAAGGVGISGLTPRDQPKTGPRYSDLPGLPAAKGTTNSTAPANPQQLSSANAAAQQAFGSLLNSLRNSGRIVSSREQKKLADVEKRIGELYQKLATGNGITSQCADVLTRLCAVLSTPQGPDLVTAKQLHLKLVTEDKGRVNLKWLTAVKQLLTFCSK